MAREEVMIRVGADTTPIARAMRGVRGIFADAQKELSQSSKRIAGDWLKAFGLAGLVAGFRDLVQSIREAGKEGEEFSKKGWFSPETIATVEAMDEALARMTNTARELAGQLIGAIGHLARLLGAFSVTGDWGKAKEIVKGMAEEDAKKLATRRGAPAAAPAGGGGAKQSGQKTLHKQLGEAEGNLVEAERKLFASKEDRSKLTIEELVTGNFHPRTRAFQEQRRAREALRQEGLGEQARRAGLPWLSERHFERADELRKSLTSVASTDRNPWAEMEENIAKAEQHLLTLITAAKKEGILIIPRNGE